MTKEQKLEAKLKAEGPSTTEEVLKEALRKAYLDSLFYTASKLCKYDEITAFTHYPIILNLEGPSKRKLICVPRGCFKSTICVVSYAVWRLLRNPNLRILIDSELYGNSCKFLREIKAIFTSPKVVDLFGDLKGEVWNEGEIILKSRTVAKKEASITCGGVGTIKVGQHYDLIIGDDYNSNKNSATPENREKIVEHYKYNLSILEQTGEYVLIGTRYAMDDLIGWVIENEIGVKDFKQKEDLQHLRQDNGVYICQT